MAKEPGGGIIARMAKIEKVYEDGTVALRGVDLVVRRGEILGLLGENGAGKTTLMKILSGFLKPTKGEIFIDGARTRIRDPSHALRLGIGMVHQHFTLVPGFTVLENLALAAPQPPGLRRLLDLAGPLRLEDTRSSVEEIMESSGLKMPLDQPVETLSMGERQRVEILKMLLRGVRLLILDEPTTFLTPHEVERLFAFLRSFVAGGRSAIFITHKIREALAIADRIVVLRRGLVSGEISPEDVTPQQLARLMVGEAVEMGQSLRGGRPGDPVLVVKDLYVRSPRGGLAVKGVSFEVRSGEIFGIAGVEGNGQDELVYAITGILRPESGRILYRGVDITGRGAGDLARLGISHIPGDRDRLGLVLEMSVVENSILTRLWDRRILRGPAIRWSRVAEMARELVRIFGIVAPGIHAPARTLSGGNRQRLVVGRELTISPGLVVAAHPTRGLDIASTLYVRRLLAEARDRGCSVILVSSDLDEILQLSDRIAVMYEGRFAGVVEAEKASPEAIGLMMGGAWS